MKRIKILLLLLLLLIIAAIICYECCGYQDPEEDCEQLIFVAVTRIPDEEYDLWQQQNQEYMYNVPTRDEKLGAGDGIIAIDASKIREVDYATWLRENGDFIFYEATYPYIECTHKIQDSTLTAISPYITMTLSQIKSQISTGGGNFTTTNYNKYTAITISTSNVLNFTMRDLFMYDKNCFSVPLFRSIVDKYGLKNSSAFQFSTAMVSGHKIVFFRIKDSKGLYHYYDFSQVPP